MSHPLLFEASKSFSKYSLARQSADLSARCAIWGGYTLTAQTAISLAGFSGYATHNSFLISTVLANGLHAPQFLQPIPTHLLVEMPNTFDIKLPPPKINE
jgi:hypothetical protein